MSRDNSTCVNICPPEDDQPSDECHEVSQGYRLVVGDVCQGGLDLARKDSNCGENSDTKHSQFTAGWLSWILLLAFIFTTAISLLLFVVIMFYHTNDQ